MVHLLYESFHNYTAFCFKSQAYLNRMVLLFPDSFTFERSLGAVRVCRSDATRRSEHLDNSPWPPPMSSHKSFIHMYLLNKVDASRLGAVEVCVYVTDQAPPCDLDAPPSLREKSDTRHQSKNMQLGAWTPTLSHLPYYYH